MKNLYKCLSIIIFLSLIGCDYTSNPIPNNDPSKSAPLENQSANDGNGDASTQIKIINFENDIKPIMTQSCLPCHGNGNPKNWQNFESTKKFALDILGSLKHEPGYKPMPMGKSKLKENQIQLIKDWIDSGMKEKADVTVSTPTQPAPVPEEPVSSEVPMTTPETTINTTESFYLTNCASCHDNQEFYPNLKGQNKQYLIDQLSEFKSGSRIDPSMNYFAQNLLVDESMIEEVASYLSQKTMDCTTIKKLAINDLKPNENSDVVAGKNLASTCLGCHSADNSTFPVLNGQNPNYLLKTLSELKSQERPSNTMKYMLDAIERQDMINLSAFFHANSGCEQ